ncbi:MAG: CBS domain-containing protein [Candidatus Njordarchaeales archaeon]
MTKLLLVRDFVREYTKVDKDDLIPQAYWTLESRKDTHLVVTEEDEPIGIVSYRDFLRVLTDRARRRHIAKLHVSSLMTEKLITIDETASIREACELMLQKNISSVLVTKGEKIVGIVTKRDILQKIDLLPPKTVRELMTPKDEVIVASSGTKITGAEQIMRENNISTLPIVSGDRLIGYIDIHILSRFLMDLFLDPKSRHPEKMLKEVTIGDIMKGPVYVLLEQSIQEFAKEVLRKHTKGAAVVLSEENMRLEGVITDTDITKYIYLEL